MLNILPRVTKKANSRVRSQTQASLVPRTHCAATADIRTAHRGFLEPGRTKMCLQGNTVFANVLSKSSVCRRRRSCSHHSREKTKTKHKNRKTELFVLFLRVLSGRRICSVPGSNIFSSCTETKAKSLLCPPKHFVLFILHADMLLSWGKKYQPFTVFKATAKINK